MAVGDHFIEKTTASGGGTATITVPASTVWVMSGFAGADAGNGHEVEHYDGSDGSRITTTKDHSGRPIFDGTVSDPRVNSGGGDQIFIVSGREL